MTGESSRKNSNLYDEVQVLLVAGTGGHGEQLKRLRRLLPVRSAVVIAEDNLSWDFPDEVVYCSRVVDYHKLSLLKSIASFLSAAGNTIRVVRSLKPKIVFSTGPALAVPVCLVCRLFRLRVIHIESWSRISSISNTTRIIRRLHLADTVVYQYPDSALSGESKCEYWGHL